MSIRQTTAPTGVAPPDQPAPSRDKVLMAEAWLAVVDGLELSMLEAGGQVEAQPEDAGGRYRAARVLDEMRAIHDQAVGMLSSLGYRRHDETGVPFDPGMHEVVRVDRDTPEPPGIVLEVLLPGYGDGEGRLRLAAVVVAGGGARG